MNERVTSDPLSAVHGGSGEHRLVLQTVLDSLIHPLYVVDAADYQVRLSTLSVINDGWSFPKRLPRKRGVGLRVMGYRAEVIGGILTVQQAPAGGTQATCEFDAEPKNRKGAKKDAAKDA